MQFHLEMKVSELVTQGWSAESARAEAERQFGDAVAVAAECRTIVERQRRGAARWRRLDTLVHDVRYGARLLTRQPGFTIMAVLTLALGMGANTAVYSVLDSLVLAPLPYPSAHRIVSIWEQNADGSQAQVAEPNYLDWTAQARTFESMAAYRGPYPAPILGGAEPVRRPVTAVTEEFFRVLRVTPLIGRLPRPEDVRADVATAVVSRSFWETWLGGQRDLDHAAVEVAGSFLPVAAVLPDGFEFPGGTDIWIVRPPDVGGTRTSHNYRVIGRIADGIAESAARAEMRAIGEDLAQLHAGAIDAVSVGITPLAESLYGSYRRPLLLLLGASAVVLLVACTNLSSSMLARSAARERELAVRSAIGANRLRLVRQLLTETSLLALLGGVAGVGLAYGVLAGLRQVAPAAALQLRDVRIDPGVLAFTLLAVTVSALLVGLIPSLRARDTGIASLLRSGDRAGNAQRSRLWNGLVGVEIALALVLLITCGLLVRSFRAIVAVDPGFDAQDVLAVDIFIPSSVHATDTAVAQLETRLLDAFGQIPGVAGAGLVNALPGLYSLNGNVFVEGRADEVVAEYRVASEGYFEAMRIPLVRGRLFESGDDVTATTTAVVDEAFAAAAFGDADPIGRRVRNLRNDSWYYGPDAWVTIVGVVGRVQPFGLLQNAAPTIYVNYRQRAMRARDATLTLRLRDRRDGTVGDIRAAMRRWAPSVPFEIGTASAQIGAGMADRRFSLWVVTGFAFIALALAAVGIHSIVSWSVERRTREMGVRIALGALPRGVALGVVREAMAVVALGIVVGVPAALLAVRMIAGMLAGIPPNEPVTILVVVGVLSVVALLAAALPARRITRIDPILALRSE